MVVLAPVWVVGVGLVAAILILLGRAAAESWRASQHKRIWLLALLGLFGLVAILTYLGVTIPNVENPS
jgi:hypothetical protein